MKNKNFWSISKNQLITLIILILFSGILFFIFITKNNKDDNNTFHDKDTVNSFNNKIKNPETSLNNSIDSILFTFGIKKDWISTDTGNTQKKAGWFVKSVSIPKDLTSVEINLDISSYLNESGLACRVTEDILSKDITILVSDPDTAKKLPAALIQVTHSEKVKREAGTIAVIIDKINEFSPEDLDRLILKKNEFSYIFPRNLDDIEIQHKLLQYKKDIVINMSIGSRENYEADFNTEMDEKSIHDKVKSFNADYPSINKVLLTKIINNAALITVQNKITAEFVKYNVTVINDSMLTSAYKSGEKDILGYFFGNIVQKAGLAKYAIAVLPLEKAEFDDFYKRIVVLKKLGYKFLNLTEYFNAIKEDKKSELEKEEKTKQEQVKKKTQDDLKKKKAPDKKEVKKKDTKKLPTEKKKK